MDEQAPAEGQKSTGDAPRLLTLASQNFAVISAILVAAAVAGSVFFVAGYLSVFDWRLLWIIEYADLIKIGLLALAVTSGFALWIVSPMEQIFHFIREETILKRLAAISLPLVMFLISLIYWIVSDYRSSDPLLLLRLYIHLSILFVFMLGALWALVYETFPAIKHNLLVNAFLLAVITPATFGRTFAYYVRDTSGFKSNVLLKTEELKDVGLVMITSHHVVLFGDQGLVVVPTADVVKFISKASGRP